MTARVGEGKDRMGKGREGHRVRGGQEGGCGEKARGFQENTTNKKRSKEHQS